MEKSQYEKEINRLICEAEEYKEKEQIAYDTSIFLEKERQKLTQIIDNAGSTDEEKEDAINKLSSLLGKIQYELNHAEDNDGEALKIENELILLISNGYEEDRENGEIV
jgi:hypothetical protein